MNVEFININLTVSLENSLVYVEKRRKDRNNALSENFEKSLNKLLQFTSSTWSR